jgi:hypothetical protein
MRQPKNFGMYCLKLGCEVEKFLFNFARLLRRVLGSYCCPTLRFSLRLSGLA